MISPDLAQTQTDLQDWEETVVSIRGLEEMAPLLIDKERFTEDAARVSAPRATQFAEIKALAYSLQLACEWDERTLLARLGCTIDLQRDAVDDGIDLDESLKFLQLLTGLTTIVDAMPECRAIVIELATLIKRLHCRTERLEEILKASQQDEPSPMDLILLGEVDRACSLARWYGGVSREWERTSGLSPFFGIETVHISTGRLDLLLDERTKELGPNVAKRMADHVVECRACAEALAARRHDRHFV